MAIIYTYPNLSSLESQDSFLVTDISDKSKTKTISWANVLLSEGLVQNIKVTLTSAQILDLHNTPVELIPAPGVNKFIQLLSIYTYLDFNTTAYVTSPSGAIYYRYGDNTTPVQEYSLAGVTQMLQKTKDTFQGGQLPTFSIDDAWLPNENVQAFSNVASFDGDSPIHVYISYIIKDL